MATRNINIVYRVNRKELEQATAATEKARQSTQNLGKQIKETESVGTKAFKAIGTAVTGIGFAALVKNIIQLGAAQQQLNIAFTTFLGDATKAKKLIAELTQFAIVTPFTPDQVNKAAKALLAFGVQGKDIIRTLKMLGDVSSGTGKDLAEMAVIFGQIRSTGRLMGQDLLQLINAGFNPLQVISEKTGRSVAALKEDMEDGAISFEMVADAFESATSEGGLFFNLMEKQSQSVAGKLSTIAGNIEEIQKGLFESNLDLIDSVVTKLTEYTDAIQKLIKIANSDPIFDKAQSNLEEYTTSTDEAGKKTDLLAEALEQISKGGGSEKANELYKDLTKGIQTYENNVARLVKQLAALPDGDDQAERITNLINADQTTVRMLTETRKALQKDAVDALLKYELGLEQAAAAEKAKKIAEFLKKFLKEGLEDANLPDIYRQYSPFTDRQIKALEQDSENMASALKNAYNEEFQLLVNKNDAELEAQEEANKKKKEQEKKHQEEIAALKQQAFNYGVDLLGQALFASIDSNQAETDAIRDSYDVRIAAASGNQRRQEEIRAEQDKALEASRKRQAELDKETAIKQMAIQNLLNSIRALGTPPVPNFAAAGLALAYGGAQIVIAKSLGFKEGVIDLNGPGTATSDSIPAMLSKGESVMTAKETDSSRGLLEMIRNRKLDDKIFERIQRNQTIVPVFNDGRIVSAIEKSRVNLSREGAILYETRQINENLRIKTRAKIIAR